MPQNNSYIRGSSHYGPIHSFKVIDVGNKKVMINRGKFMTLGSSGGEQAITGDLAGKMVEHLWNDHDSSKAFTVSEGDIIFLRIKYNDTDATAVGASVTINYVTLEKDGNATPGTNEKIVELARIISQEEVAGGNFITKIEQIQKSDVYEIILGTYGPENSSDVCSFTVGTSLNVVVGFSSSISGDCVVLIPLMKTISFCGEIGVETLGTAVNICSPCCSSTPP